MKSYLLENDKLSVCIVPELGGKSISVFDKGKQFELLAQKEERLLHKKNDLKAFVDCAAYGFDDAFPSISAGGIWVEGEWITYPDHGEIWSTVMEVQQWDEEKQELVLSCKGRMFPYHYEKRIKLQNRSVLYSYHITNVGKESFPCLWAFHCLARYEEDMRILFPEETHTFVNVLESKELGEKETEYQVYEINGELKSEETAYRFSRVPKADSYSMEKYYLKEAVKKGSCGYEYPSQGVRSFIRYEADQLPYLGFFVTAGGLMGDYNCALEPCDGYYDSIETALKNQRCQILMPGNSKKFEIEIKIEEMD